LEKVRMTNNNLKKLIREQKGHLKKNGRKPAKKRFKEKIKTVLTIPNRGRGVRTSSGERTPSKRKEGGLEERCENLRREEVRGGGDTWA